MRSTHGKAMTDRELLDQYRNGSSAAAEELILRHGNWVYCVARRRVGNAELARDVAQATFLVLVQKAPRLSPRRPLSAWLYRVVSLASAQALRSESRRRRRETEAARMRQEQTTTPATDRMWNDVAPMLDELVVRLRRRDRDAVLLRFFEQMSLAQVGSVLGISEEAARKRVSRATEALRRMFAAKGVVVPAAALPALMLTHTSDAGVSAGLGSISAFVQSARSSGLAKGVMTMMTWMKIKIAVSVLLPLLVVGGAGATILISGGEREPAAAATTSPTAAAVTAEKVHLTLQPTGLMPKIGTYVPHEFLLTETKPTNVRKLPPDLANPLYGVLPMTAPPGATHYVVVDEPADRPSRLFVDTNGNGDLTDDPSTEWSSSTAKWSENGKEIEPKRPDGKPCLTWQGGAMVDLEGGVGAETPYRVHVGMYRFDPLDPYRSKLTHTLLFYRDYATTGEMELGGKKYTVALSDENASGDYTGPADPDNLANGVHLLIDRDGDGRFNGGRDVNVEVHSPFNLNGQVYKLADIAKDGLSFRVVKSDQQAPELIDLPGPADMVGKPAIAFTASTMDDKPVDFPADFKGKIVMLDFWATWCGPCLAEMPTVAACYEKFHAQGLQIVGVSLDQVDAEKTINTVCAEKKMTWPQIYDGGGWKARIAVTYHVHGIPCAILVDGDSGKVIAADSQLRGPALAQTVEKALADKAAK